MEAERGVDNVSKDTDTVETAGIHGEDACAEAKAILTVKAMLRCWQL